MKNFFFLILGILVIASSIFLFLQKPVARDGLNKTLKIGDTTIVAETATTPKSREQGLSGRVNLAEGTGMLFIFDTSGNYGFWMKDMNFAIDIVWIDENGKIVGIEKSVAPETFPQSFYPNQPVKYVLELPSGFSDIHHIGIGAVIQ